MVQAPVFRERFGAEKPSFFDNDNASRASTRLSDGVGEVRDYPSRRFDPQSIDVCEYDAGGGLVARCERREAVVLERLVGFLVEVGCLWGELVGLWFLQGMGSLELCNAVDPDLLGRSLVQMRSASGEDTLLQLRPRVRTPRVRGWESQSTTSASYDFLRYPIR